MGKRFRYALEPARLAALAEERVAGHRHCGAREALTRCEALLAALGAENLPLQCGPAGIFAARVAHVERARTIGEAEVAEAREACRDAREVLQAAVARRARFDAHRASRLAAYRRDEAAADERRRFADSLCGPGACSIAFETAPV